MNDQPMSWDQALLRKFSSTGHFRLLNQVRNELKSQPLNRDPQTRKLTLQARPHHGQSVRQQRRPNPVPEDQPILTPEETIKDNPTSFRERLNAIEMR